uniref:Uncharacterized protein n=1 Tax=Glossina palpalis gambiensis TaxID=67801 RepID=A0A1B0BLT7_9MUSC
MNYDRLCRMLSIDQQEEITVKMVDIAFFPVVNIDVIYLSIKYIDRFCITQNKPTQKSANAKLAKKKFVIERKRRDNVTTSMTNKFPKQQQNTIVYNVINMTRTSVRSNIYSLELTLSARLYELLLSALTVHKSLAAPVELLHTPDATGLPQFALDVSLATGIGSIVQTVAMKISIM